MRRHRIEIGQPLDQDVFQVVQANFMDGRMVGPAGVGTSGYAFIGQCDAHQTLPS